MPTQLEKAAFAKRLRMALNRSSDSVKGATELAMRFNLRHRAGAPVSPQTAHKWLSGRSIPTAEKILTLASWLDVSAHWLQYGPAPLRPLQRNAMDNVSAYQPSGDVIALAGKIQALSAHHRYLLEELVLQLNHEIPPA
jgi:transcriptional regulator with XRE-family HTH domain